MMFPCSVCHELKPRSEFHRDRGRSTGVASRCKECSRRRNGVVQERATINTSDNLRSLRDHYAKAAEAFGRINDDTRAEVAFHDAVIRAALFINEEADLDDRRGIPHDVFTHARILYFIHCDSARAPEYRDVLADCVRLLWAALSGAPEITTYTEAEEKVARLRARVEEMQAAADEARARPFVFDPRSVSDRDQQELRHRRDKARDVGRYEEYAREAQSKIDEITAGWDDQSG